MAEMYFSCGEKEKGLALLARIKGTGPADVPPSSIDIDAASSSRMYSSAIEVLDTTNAATQAKTNEGLEEDDSSSSSSGGGDSVFKNASVLVLSIASVQREDKHVCTYHSAVPSN